MKREKITHKIEKIGNWFLSGEAKVDYLSERSIPIIEQECNINIDRFKDMCYICCSDQRFLTKLKKNPLFEIREILLSNSLSDYDLKILQVSGTLPLKAISFRTKITSTTDTDLELQDQEVGV